MLPAAGRKRVEGQPAVLMPNPFYQPISARRRAVNAEPVFLDATEATGHLPDLDALEKDTATLERTVAFYLCSPANPQGSVASADYIRKALALARQYNFMLFFDECYSEIYTHEAPTGGLQVAAHTPEGFKNLVVFNSLSKRSNLPGMRSGFAAGDADFLETLAEVRNLTAPQMPGVVQHASDRGVVRGAARRRHPPGLPRQIRHLRRAARRPIRLPAARRRLLPLARYEPFGRRRRRYGNPMETLRCQGCPWCLPGPDRTVTGSIPARNTFA